MQDASSSRPRGPSRLSDRHPNGFFVASRSRDGLELIGANPNAFVLLYVVALRAQVRARINRHCLSPGQALIGDHRECGLTEREYRTAKKTLEKLGIATFQGTNKGTIATITNTSIFDINSDANDEQEDDRETSKRRTPDDYQEALEEKKGGERLSDSERIVLSKEYERIVDEMKSISGGYDGHQSWTAADAEKFKELKAKRKEYRERLGIA